MPEADKLLVFHEAFRLLKPGGRVAISDILATQELTKDIKDDLSLFFWLHIWGYLGRRL